MNKPRITVFPADNAVLYLHGEALAVEATLLPTGVLELTHSNKFVIQLTSADMLQILLTSLGGEGRYQTSTNKLDNVLCWWEDPLEPIFSSGSVHVGGSFTYVGFDEHDSHLAFSHSDLILLLALCLPDTTEKWSEYV